MGPKDVKFGTRPFPYAGLRNGGFEARFIAQFNQNSLIGSRVFPKNGELTKIGLFKFVGDDLAITSNCVKYLLGRDKKIAGMERTHIDEVVGKLSNNERLFLGELTHQIEEVYAEIFRQEEGVRVEALDPEHLKAAKRWGVDIELPQPTTNHIKWVIDQTAKKLSMNTSLMKKVLSILNLELR